MAFDGVTIAGLVYELKTSLIGGRVYKIYQPENDELNLIIKNNRENYRLLISASPSLPLMYITKIVKENPATAPNFAMLLRKHIGNGRITNIYQVGLERIVVIDIEHLDELGDLCRKHLYIELMGKHSNIIFADDDNNIIDSIKHVSAQISSVREVLPGRNYVFPPIHDKLMLGEVTREYFLENVLEKNMAVSKAIYTSIVGFSNVIGQELCYRANIDGNALTSSIDDSKRENLYNQFVKLVADINDNRFTPSIVSDGDTPMEFGSIVYDMYSDKHIEVYEDVSTVLATYYQRKEQVTRIRQKSVDLRKIVSTAIERSTKKYELQLKQMKDTENRDKFKVYGELINTYGYSLSPEDKVLVATNYYNGEEVKIPIDNTKTPMENGQRYFEKYNKLKRTYEALSVLTVETKEELDYLLSVQHNLDIALSENDLAQIKEELIETGHIKGKYTSKKKRTIGKSKPFHYISSDGFHMYVGKNNLQNDELTFKIANGNDMWFHAKNMPGSHVIVKVEGAKELPDSTYEEAARLAAFYSSGNEAPKVEIDYTKRSNLKKPPKANPGYVIYHTNYSMNIAPDIKGIEEII